MKAYLLMAGSTCIYRVIYMSCHFYRLGQHLDPRWAWT